MCSSTAGCKLLCNQQVGNGVQTVRANWQWASLGDLTAYSCFPQPLACEAVSGAGATLTLWMEVLKCNASSRSVGFLSSIESFEHTGFQLLCDETQQELVYVRSWNSMILVVIGAPLYICCRIQWWTQGSLNPTFFSKK